MQGKVFPLWKPPFPRNSNTFFLNSMKRACRTGQMRLSANLSRFRVIVCFISVRHPAVRQDRLAAGRSVSFCGTDNACLIAGCHFAVRKDRLAAGPPCGGAKCAPMVRAKPVQSSVCSLCRPPGPPFGVRLGCSRGKPAAKTDNRREAAAEINFIFFPAKFSRYSGRHRAGSGGQLPREHYSPLFPLPRKAENGVRRTTAEINFIFFPAKFSRYSGRQRAGSGGQQAK